MKKNPLNLFLPNFMFVLAVSLILQGCWERQESPGSNGSASGVDVVTTTQPQQTVNQPIFRGPTPTQPRVIQPERQSAVSTNNPIQQTRQPRTINPVNVPIPTPTNQPSSSPSADSSSSQNTCDGKVVNLDWNFVRDNDGFKYYAGYKQVTRNNQDAYLIKTDSNNRQCYEKKLTTAPPDEKCQDIDGLFESSQLKYLYILCSTDGGNTSFRSVGNGFQRSYGQGGGPRIAYIAKLDPNGRTISSTFLGGKLRSNGRTNTLRLENISVSNNKVNVSGTTAFGSPLTQTPIRSSNQVQNVCERSGSSYNADLSLDLTTLLRAECF